MIKLHNIILFVVLAIWYGTPIYLWPYAWRKIQERHRAEVHKAVWELKKQGKIREDKEGYLWPRKEDKQ